MKKIILNILNPLFLYNLIWLLLIIGHKMSFTLWNAENANYSFIYLSMFSFSLGCITVILICIGNNNIREESIEINKKKLCRIVKILFIIFLLEEFLLFFKLGLPPLLNATTSRNEYYLPFIGIIYLLYVAITYLAIILKVLNYKKVQMNLILLTVFIFIVLKANKFAIIEFVLICILTKLIIKKNQISLKKMCFIACFIIFIIVLSNKYFYFKYYNLNLNKIILINNYKGNPKYAVFIMPYLYIFSNIENILNYINYETIYSYGTQTTYGFLKIFCIDKLVPNLFFSKFNESLKYPWLNTGTYLLPYFSDFKEVGLIFFPYIFGILSQYYYIKTYTMKNTILSNFLTVAFIVTIIFSFFTNYLSTISFAINLIVIFLIKQYLKKGVYK